MMNVDILRKAFEFAAVPMALILSLAAVSTQRCVAQTQASNLTTVAVLHDSDSNNKGRTGDATANTAAKAAPAGGRAGVETDVAPAARPFNSAFSASICACIAANCLATAGDISGSGVAGADDNSHCC